MSKDNSYKMVKIAEFAELFTDKYGGNPKRLVYRIRSYIERGHLPFEKGNGRTSPKLISTEYIDNPPQGCVSLYERAVLNRVINRVVEAAREFKTAVDNDDLVPLINSAQKRLFTAVSELEREEANG